MQSLKALRRRALLATDYHVGEQIRLAALLRALHPLMTDGVTEVLDAGSGNGRVALLLARRYAQAHIHGVDMNRPALVGAGEQARHQGLVNIDFAYADLTQPLGDASYDLIYNVDVMEHIAEDCRVLANFARALRPGGWLIIHTPLTPQYHFLHRFDLPVCVNDLHVREGYQRGELEQKLADVGLEVWQRVYTHGRWGTLAWELWKLTRWRLLPKLLLRPLIQSLIWAENSSQNHDGNCILAVAQKPGT